MKKIICLLFVSLLTFSLQASPSLTPVEAARKQVYQAYLHGDLDAWTAALTQLEEIQKKQKAGEIAVLQELSMAQYGIIGLCIAKKEENQAQAWIEKLEDNLATWLKYEPRSSEAYAIMGGLYGLKIGLAPFKAMFLGPKSTGALSKARKYDPESPSAWAEYGNVKFFAPPIFGGNSQEAVACYKKAAKLYDEQPNKQKYCWLYLHTLAYLGQAYEKAGLSEEAIKTYERALAFEPEFGWVEAELLPALRKKLMANKG